MRRVMRRGGLGVTSPPLIPLACDRSDCESLRRGNKILRLGAALAACVSYNYNRLDIPRPCKTNPATGVLSLWRNLKLSLLYRVIAGQFSCQTRWRFSSCGVCQCQFAEESRSCKETDIDRNTRVLRFRDATRREEAAEKRWIESGARPKG